MDVRKPVLLLTISFFLLFSPLSLLAGSQENPLVQAMKLFDQNKFKEAEKILGELIIDKPDDLMINYFYGASLTENQQYGQQEIIYLLKGSSGESPLKADFYLGIQYHAQNRWDDALKHYQLFEEQSTVEEVNELKVAEKISQCTEHINPFQNRENQTEDIAPSAISRPGGIVETIPAAAVYPKEVSIDSSNFEQTVPDNFNYVDLLSTQAETRISIPEPINFVVNDDFTYIDSSHFRTDEGFESFKKWRMDQKALDSLTISLNNLRSEFSTARNTLKRNELGQKIMDAENHLLPLQRKVKEQLNAARLAENTYWSNATEEEYNAFNTDLQKWTEVINASEKPNIPALDTSLIIAEVFEDVVPATAKENEESGDELVYKIQIGAYSRGLPDYIQKKFDKLSYIRKIDKYTDDRGVVVYTTGTLSMLDDAVKMQKQVRQEGIEDAFVVPYFNGKRITLEEAKKIEKER